jgi:hypothetical protein
LIKPDMLKISNLSNLQKRLQILLTGGRNQVQPKPTKKVTKPVMTTTTMRTPIVTTTQRLPTTFSDEDDEAFLNNLVRIF